MSTEHIMNVVIRPFSDDLSAVFDELTDKSSLLDSVLKADGEFSKGYVLKEGLDIGEYVVETIIGKDAEKIVIIVPDV